jgi:uncharacterized protein
MNEPVFLDTSGLYAVFDEDDAAHPAVAEAWKALVDSSASLYTSSYVLVELIALLQRRLGLGAVEALSTYVLPWLQVSWVDETVHGQAAAALMAAGKRDVSLVDCASFVLMRRLGVRRVLAVDRHFAEQGFVILPEGE